MVEVNIECDKVVLLIGFNCTSWSDSMAWIMSLIYLEILHKKHIETKKKFIK